MISRPRTLPAGLGGTQNAPVDSIINSPQQGPSSLSGASPSTQCCPERGSPDPAICSRALNPSSNTCAPSWASHTAPRSQLACLAHRETSSPSSGEAPRGSMSCRESAWRNTSFIISLPGLNSSPAPPTQAFLPPLNFQSHPLWACAAFTSAFTSPSQSWAWLWAGPSGAQPSPLGSVGGGGSDGPS